MCEMANFIHLFRELRKYMIIMEFFNFESDVKDLLKDVEEIDVKQSFNNNFLTGTYSLNTYSKIR